jgi:hypothetical protein
MGNSSSQTTDFISSKQENENSKSEMTKEEEISSSIKRVVYFNYNMDASEYSTIVEAFGLNWFYFINLLFFFDC